MKKLLNEFKNFALKGNVVDMAVGVVVGGAFSKIVTSLVDNIITPFIGFVTGGIDFSSQFAVTIGNSTMNFGALISDIIDFIIIAACIFAVIKGINAAESKLSKKEEEAVAEKAPTTEELLTDIKTLLSEMKDK